MTTAADILENAAAIYRERNQVYGDNYLRLGKAMHAIFPQGLDLKAPEDWTRLYFLMLMLVKASRYATNFNSGGHNDSSIDACVYAAMLHGYDQQCKHYYSTQKPPA